MNRLRRRNERGAISVEFVVLLPVLVILIGVVVVGARVWWSRATVQQLAASAARQASISRSAGDAQSSARDLVRNDALRTSLKCSGGGPALSLDTSGFAIPVGEPATVNASVTCVVALSDVSLPFVPGSMTVSAEATSTLDRYRERG